MDFWPTIGIAAATALVTTLVTQGVTSGIPLLIKRLLRRRPDWIVRKNRLGRWEIERTGRRSALQPEYWLAEKGQGVRGPEKLSPLIIDGHPGNVVEFDPPLDVEWDEIGVSWIDRERRSGNVYRKDDVDEYPLYADKLEKLRRRR